MLFKIIVTYHIDGHEVELLEVYNGFCLRIRRGTIVTFATGTHPDQLTCLLEHLAHLETLSIN